MSSSLNRRNVGGRPWLLAWGLALGLSGLVSCGHGGPGGSGLTPLASDWPKDGDFDDHTVERLPAVEAFHALAASNDAGVSVVKFVIVGFGESTAPRRARREHLRFLDGNFYEFHDQWYWFRLLNGHPVPGARDRPYADAPKAFSTVAQTVAWLETQGQLPLAMRNIDGRMYSDYFYELAIRREPRTLGVGTLVHLPAREEPAPREEIWAFELEYSDTVESGELEHFFAVLSTGLPPAIADELQFIARSPQQERLVARLEGRDHALGDRVLNYGDLATPGEIQVYNPGLVAGRLRKPPDDPERAAAVLAEGDDDAIWMLPRVPDELPTGIGLITATPQTPLAHVNLLARNRGVPNVYVGGLMDDPQLDQLARVHAPVAVFAGADGTLSIEAISDEEYRRWRWLNRRPPPVLHPVDPQSMPWTLDLEDVALEEIPRLRAVIGGKSAGFPMLDVDARPERPLAITARAYVEHLAELQPWIAALMEDPDFDQEGRLRYLMLEGREAFEARFVGPEDGRWLAAFLAEHPPPTSSKAKAKTSGRRRGKKAPAPDPVAELLARGGIKRAIRDRPISADARAAIGAALDAHFGSFAVTQGLRFRSSSTVEDIQGFSGAGLYDSNTGFLDAGAQATKKDQKRSAEWAIKKTWASYWSWEAYEERRTTGIDHLAGAMAVLVHARFDDPKERANGVITFTYDASSQAAGVLQRPAPRPLEMEIDVQAGALSVTNPPPERAGEVLPEIIRVYTEAGALGALGALKIERVASSSERAPGAGPILDDEAAQALLVACRQVAERWLAVDNAGLAAPQAATRVTLDFEFRWVEAGWPAYGDGRPEAPSRVVLKQVRSLEPGLPALTAATGTERGVLDEPIPRDILNHARAIERHRCQSGHFKLTALELWTAALATPPMGYDGAPFLARLRVAVRGVPGGPRTFDLDHRAFTEVGHPGLSALGEGVSTDLARSAPWTLSVGAPELGTLRIEGGLARLEVDGEVLVEEPMSCREEPLLDSPDDYLRSLLRR